jgi:transposase-like protein
MKDKKKRLSAKMKAEVILKYLQGQGLDILSREYQVPSARIIEWKETFIKSGLQGFKKHAKDAPLRDAHRVIGQQAMEIELYKKRLQYKGTSQEK